MACVKFGIIVFVLLIVNSDCRLFDVSSSCTDAPLCFLTYQGIGEYYSKDINNMTERIEIDRLTGSILNLQNFTVLRSVSTETSDRNTPCKSLLNIRERITLYVEEEKRRECVCTDFYLICTSHLKYRVYKL